MEKVVSLFTVSLKKFKHPGICKLKKKKKLGVKIKPTKNMVYFVSNFSSEEKKTKIHSGQEKKQIF